MRDNGPTEIQEALDEYGAAVPGDPMTLIGSASSAPPDAGDAIADIYLSCFDSQTLRLDARVRKWNGEDLTPADVESISYTIYLLNASDHDSRVPVSGHNAVSLNPTEVVFDPVRSDGWAANYNFSFIPSIAEDPAFETSGALYEVDVTIMPVEGERLLGPRFRVGVK
jgi:hypothetical protein